jgi:hypothetical protein
MSLRLTIILFFTAAFLAHGLLLLNDAHVADGRFLKFYMQKGDLEPYLYMLRTSGAYVYVWIHEFFGQVSMKFYKVGMFINILLSSILIYAILRFYSPLKKNHCLFIAFLALVWPVYHVSVDTTFFPVWFFPTAFYFGWLIFLYQKEKGGHLALVLLSYFFMLVSFNYNACLVYQFVLLGVYFLYLNGYPKNLMSLDFKTKVPEFIKSSWGLIALPLLYWWLKKVYMMPYGSKLGYNEVRLFSTRTLEYSASNVVHLFFDFLVSPFFLGVSVWIALILAATGTTWLFKRICLKETRMDSRAYYQSAIILGVVGACCLAVPFAAVAKYFELFNLSARHGILVAPFFGLFLVGMVGYLLVKKGGRWARWENLILCQIIIYLVFLDISLYSSWQARYVKDVAVTAQLAKQEPLPNVSVYLIRDHMPRGRHPYIRSEGNLVFFEAWGREEFIGIFSFENDPQKIMKLVGNYVDLWKIKKDWSSAATTNFNSKGCVGELIIFPRQKKNEVSTAFKSVYYKILDRNKLNSFLDSMATVELKPLGFDSEGNPCV